MRPRKIGGVIIGGYAKLKAEIIKAAAVSADARARETLTTLLTDALIRARVNMDRYASAATRDCLVTVDLNEDASRLWRAEFYIRHGEYEEATP